MPVEAAWCGTYDGLGWRAHWRHMAAAPPDAAEMRRLADAAAAPSSDPADKEWWFSERRGAVMLCRARTIPVMSYGGSSSVFIHENGRPKPVGGVMVVVNDG